MLQTQYPKSPRKGFQKPSKVPQQKNNLVVQKPPTRLFMGRPINDTPSIGLLPTASPEKIIQEHTLLYNTLLENHCDITCMDTRSLFCNRFVSIHHPPETGRTHSFGVLYSCKEAIDEKVLLYIQEQYQEFIYYDMRYNDPWSYLEGLESIVVDRYTKTLYAHLSSKTYYWKLLHLHTALGYNLQLMGYSGKEERFPYTSYLIAIGETWAIVCTEVLGEYYKKAVIEHLQKTKKVLEINTFQLQNYCTGVLEIHNQDGKKLTLMSSRAYSHFTEEQREIFKNIVHIPLDAIEKAGGNLRKCILEI